MISLFARTVVIAVVSWGITSSASAGTLSDARLVDVAHSYMTFMSDVGKGVPESEFSQKVPQLFADSCRKVVNGSVWFESSEGMVPQLRDTKEKAGQWKITISEVIPSAAESASVVRFVWNSPKLGTYTTLVILHVDDEGRITEVNEVYNKYDG